jgi:hypothetical protein
MRTMIIMAKVSAAKQRLVVVGPVVVGGPVVLFLSSW